MTQPQWLAQQAQAAAQPQQFNQFGQQPQGWTPPVVGANLAIGGADAPQSAGTAPTISHMMMQPGRLVAIIPMKIERGVKAPGENKTQDRITADVLIIDGGPITYGGKPWARPPIPDTFVIQQLPYLARNVWISNSVLVTQLERKVGNGIVVGRLYYGEAKNGNNAPYKISEDPTQEEIAFVTQWWAAYSAGQWQNPAATPLQPQTLAGAPNPFWGAPGAAPSFGQAPMSMGGFAAPLQPQSAPPAAAQPGYLGDPWAAYQGGQQQQQAPTFMAPATPAAPGITPVQPASAPPAPEPDWTLTTFPPGFPEEHKAAWAQQATKEQRVQLLAQHGINGPGQPPTGL